SGDGTMTVAPTGVTGGSTNTFTFSFTAVHNFNSGSQLSLLVPAGWTTPQNTVVGTAGYVSVANGGGANGCTSTPTIASITGSTILLNINCADTKRFTLTYASATAPATVATPANNIYTFTTQTMAAGDVLKPITSTQPTVTVSGPGTQLAFTQQPSASSAGGTSFGTQPKVTIKDIAGSVMTTDNSTQVTLAITSGTGTAGATLGCTSNTVTAIGGVATFGGCDVDKAGTGYTLSAT